MSHHKPSHTPAPSGPRRLATTVAHRHEVQLCIACVELLAANETTLAGVLWSLVQCAEGRRKAHQLPIVVAMTMVDPKLAEHVELHTAAKLMNPKKARAAVEFFQAIQRQIRGAA